MMLDNKALAKLKKGRIRIDTEADGFSHGCFRMVEVQKYSIEVQKKILNGDVIQSEGKKHIAAIENQMAAYVQKRVNSHARILDWIERTVKILEEYKDHSKDPTKPKPKFKDIYLQGKQILNIENE